MKIHSLRIKFVLLFLLFFFVLFGILTFLSVSMSKSMMKLSTISHLQNLVEIKGLAIEQWLKERIGDGKAISESEEVKSLNRSRVEPYLNLVKHFYQAYLDISIVGLSRSSFENGCPPMSIVDTKDSLMLQPVLHKTAVHS